MKTLSLAGGLGTRLRSVLADVPKPMAPVRGRPFLEYVIAHLARYGQTDIVLSTGHLGEQIRDHFGDGSGHGVNVVYSHEDRPLGTGGAIKLAEPHLGGDDDSFMVMNGDSFLAADLSALIDHHRQRGALATLSVISTDDPSRYGGVELATDGSIVRFVEKGEPTAGPGLINAGIYLFRRELLAEIPAGVGVSLEREVFPTLIGRGFCGLQQDAFFIDIGVPATYHALECDPRGLTDPVARTEGDDAC